MNASKLQGLIAATYTPLHANGSLNVDVIPSLVQHFSARPITGLYVCGSTGEGMSLSTDERRRVAEAYVAAADERLPVIVQVGHNSLAESKTLAGHAGEIGADAISATCPSYFKVSDVATLVECMAEVAGGAPNVPFYYYHIPTLTGSTLDMISFLEQASPRIPNLAGLKYSDTKLHEFLECQRFGDSRFDVVWGCDEMLLGALATGASAGIGSTYNIASNLYANIIDAFNSGDVVEARRLQALSVAMVRTIGRYPFHPAMKAVLRMQGFDVGGCRLPLGTLSPSDADTLQSELTDIGFFEWS